MNKLQIERYITGELKKEKKQRVLLTPCAEQVDFYLCKWDNQKNYRLQESALNKLFHEIIPNNKDIEDVLIKASTLNDFYSTNIFSIYPVAEHIVSLDIDEQIQKGCISLVSEIQSITIGDVEKNFYSFATKYCSHHNPVDFPIYDSYVDEVLRYFRRKDHFCAFNNYELKNYGRFKQILIDFTSFYKLENYTLKQIDQYLWQLGKDYFPMTYKKNGK